MTTYKFSEQEKMMLESIQQPYAVFQYDNKVIPLALSEGFVNLFGYNSKESAKRDLIQNNTMYLYVHPDDLAKVEGETYNFIVHDEKYDIVYRSRNNSTRDYKMIHSQGKKVTAPDGTVLIHIWYTDEGIYSEPFEELNTKLNRLLSSALQRENFMKANGYDVLTGLPNMTYFFEHTDKWKDDILSKNRKPVIIFFNLRGMRYYNQDNGVASGDNLLKAFAKILTYYFNKDQCCRVGSDHFVVSTVDENLEEILANIFENTKSLNFGVSLPVAAGIYSITKQNEPTSSACDKAKFACNAIRKIHESTFNYYNQDLLDKFTKREYIVTNLDRAIKEKWIQVYFQPIVRAVNSKVCDEEALARWIDPVNGFMSPADFIPVLEEAELIYKLDLFILEQVLEKMQKQKEFNLHVVPQSINLSRADFDSCDIVEEIRRRVDDSGFPRNMITIEITESIIGKNFTYMKEQVERFQKLGFSVWMDDFGSGYSSLNVLQNIRFDLIKFDMSFMRKLDEGKEGKIILTELMNLATSLGVDTICEGVETEHQRQFLLDIGCSKLQGYYFCKPIPFEEIVSRYKHGKQIGFEIPETSEYYETISRINLNNLTVISGAQNRENLSSYNSLPMAVFEIRGDVGYLLRSNQAARDFIKRYYSIDLNIEGSVFIKNDDLFKHNVVSICCETGVSSFYDEVLANGSIIRLFARKIASNPVTGYQAVIHGVLSVSAPNDRTTYETIARALAADYYRIFYVDLNNDSFIEYKSPVGGGWLAIERHGDNFFKSINEYFVSEIYKEDQHIFKEVFTKENITRNLDNEGNFNLTYRQIEKGEPVFVSMKITRIPGRNCIIIGISIVDSQIKEIKRQENNQKQIDTLTGIMALSQDYICLYYVDLKDLHYLEYSTSPWFESFGFNKEGDDFFNIAIMNGKQIVHPEDYEFYKESLQYDNILNQIKNLGFFQIRYRMKYDDDYIKVVLKIVKVTMNSREKLIVALRKWEIRHDDE